MLSIREQPPLRLSLDIETPSGRRYRWGDDEPDAADVPTGLKFSNAMPGGHEQLDVVLPRKQNVVYSDLDRLSTVTVRGAGAAVAWEGRLESAARTSGEELSVSPGCVGWQAHLDDDKSVRIPYVDRDHGGWDGPSRQRQIDLLTAGWNRVEAGGTQPDPTTGIPALNLTIQGAQGDSQFTAVELWYDSRSEVGSVYYDYVITGGSAASVAFDLAVADDDAALNEISTGDLYGSASGSGTFTPATARRWAKIALKNEATWGDENARIAHARYVAVFGNHGLTKRGTAPDQGFYASDVVAHAVGEWCPLLTFTEGAEGSIRPSSFVIEHLAFTDDTTVSEIVRQATRFDLQDWAVWDDKTFWLHDRGAVGRKWRARSAQAKLEETGPQMERLFQSVLVEYRDVSGRTMSAGPPGSGADTEDASLEDTDPENPANQLGIVRREKLSMQTSTAAGAVKVGATFLEQAKLLDRSGRAALTGFVEDDRGVVHPAWRVRAGDEISFVDAADPSYRRIVRASYSHSDRTCSVDLDAPPEGLQALLERLSAAVAPLNL